MIEQSHKKISLQRQCELLSIARSSYYYQPSGEKDHNLRGLIDKEYTKYPFYGYRRITVSLQKKGYNINHKKVSRLMREMGLFGICPKRNLSKANKGHKKYPYLLRGVTISKPNHVWSTDITYVHLKKGFAYLTAIIDWYSRYVLNWEISNSLENSFCINSLEKAYQYGKPEIFNTDQGVQYTANNFLSILIEKGIAISMDGKGRALDNVFVERLWRTVKYENIFLQGYEKMTELYQGLKKYFQFYNEERPHQSLSYRTPKEVYFNL